MKNVTRIILLIFLLAISKEMFAQTNETECNQLIYNKIDSLFVSQIGRNQYLEMRDKINIMLKLKVDSMGSFNFCYIVKSGYIEEKQKELLCQFMLSCRFPCLNELYVRNYDPKEVKLYFSFIPKNYPFIW